VSPGAHYVLCYRYDCYLFFGQDRLELSYVTHLQYISDLFRELGITSKKKTHAPRGSGARDAYENRQVAASPPFQSDVLSQWLLTFEIVVVVCCRFCNQVHVAKVFMYLQSEREGHCHAGQME